MEHIWSVLCQIAIEDKRRNNLSLVETLEQIVFRTDEADVESFRITLYLASMWWRSQIEQPELARCRLLVNSPQDKTLNQTEYKIDLTEQVRRKHIITIHGMPYQGDGVYRFIIQINDKKRWKTVASVPLEIRKAPARD